MDIRHVSRGLVSQEERHLKAAVLDVVELLVLWLCGLLIFTFTATVFLDVVSRTIGTRMLWLQEVTLIAFVWGVFAGAAVAVRRNEHFYLTAVASSMTGRRRVIVETFNGAVMLTIVCVIAYFGVLNSWQNLGNILPVTGLPLTAITSAIPFFGVLAAVFTVERLVNGWRNGFAGLAQNPEENGEPAEPEVGQIR